MKKLFLPFTILFSISLSAQEEVLFDRTMVHGGFGGPIIEWTSMDDQSGLFAGGGGGVIVNDFFIGGFGQGGSFAERVIDNTEYPINFGYGGLWLGYVKPSLKAIHFFGGLKIGAGGISITEERNGNGNSLYNETVFVAQPEVGIEVNLFKWFRLALTGNYRIVAGIQQSKLAGLGNHDFNSGGVGLTLRFGKFYRENNR